MQNFTILCLYMAFNGVDSCSVKENTARCLSLQDLLSGSKVKTALEIKIDFLNRILNLLCTSSKLFIRMVFQVYRKTRHNFQNVPILQTRIWSVKYWPQN